MYSGTVFFHLYPELTDPKPIFNSFLEGALHCCEVAKSHPHYATAHFHEAYDQQDAIDGKPYAYFNMGLFSCPPQELYSSFEDLEECLDLGHMNQVHHPLPCREVACWPDAASAIAGRGPPCPVSDGAHSRAPHVRHGYSPSWKRAHARVHPQT